MSFVLHTKYLEASYDKDKNLMIFHWKDETMDMTETEFISELDFIAFFIRLYRPRNIIVFTLQLYFIITPHLQKQMNALLVPVYNNSNVQNVAMIVPKELFRKSFIEAAAEFDSKNSKFNLRFFENREQALSWIANASI